MAELQQAMTTASAKSNAGKKIFGKLKAPDVIIYRLIKKNQKLREDSPVYPPYRRFPNYDLIKWTYPNEDGTETEGTRAIRYLPGFGSIFVDEQEAGNRVIPDNVLNNPNNRFEIIDGEIRVPPHQKTKIQFLDLCNRNSESQHRTGQVEVLFARYSEEQKIADLQVKQKKQREAMEKAYSADEAQIAFHAKYLGIPLVDPSTSATRTFEAVSADYIQSALDNPSSFLETFDDEDLKLKYKIESAIEANFINLNLIPGKAVYTATKGEICTVPEKTELKHVVDALFMFTQTKNGGDLVKKLNEL